MVYAGAPLRPARPALAGRRAVGRASACERAGAGAPLRDVLVGVV